MCKLEAELTAHLGYPRHAPEGHHSGNSRNGKPTRQLRTSTGDITIQVPPDRNSTFQSPLLDAYQTSTNELEEKIIGLYAKGMSARDIQETLQQAYGVEVSAATISTVTDKVWSLYGLWPRFSDRNGNQGVLMRSGSHRARPFHATWARAKLWDTTLLIPRL